MKISNETKVGALTSIAIVMMILGFNFLKGKSLFKTGNFIYADFQDTKGLMVSNPVFSKGFQIGSIYEIENTDASLKTIRVAIKLNQAFQIPNNSVAIINSNPLGSSSINIQLGNSTTFLNSNSVITTKEDGGILAEISSNLNPAIIQIKSTFQSLDSALKNFNSLFNQEVKTNFQATIANINKVTSSLEASTKSIEQMLSQQSGSIAQSMNNVSSFTKNLSANNDKITNTINNLETTTKNLSKADLTGSVTSLKQSIEKLNGLLNKIDSKDGSLGLLLNDKTLYNNLTNTARSANILLDDLKTHPKRYVNISVFGKKDKSTPLTAPLNDSSSKH